MRHLYANNILGVSGTYRAQARGPPRFPLRSGQVRKPLCCRVLEKGEGRPPRPQAWPLEYPSRLPEPPRLSCVSVPSPGLSLPLALFPETPHAGSRGPRGARDGGVTALWATRGRPGGRERAAGPTHPFGSHRAQETCGSPRKCSNTV